MHDLLATFNLSFEMLPFPGPLLISRRYRLRDEHPAEAMTQTVGRLDRSGVEAQSAIKIVMDTRNLYQLSSVILKR